MAGKGLNPKQKRMLEFIQEFDQEWRCPPTIRDIQQGCGISSTSVVEYNLRVLEREGQIRRRREVSRGIEVLDGGRDRGATPGVPVLGYIAAGEPIPVPTEDSWGAAEPLDVLDVPKGLLAEQRGVYALRVKGTSMIDALVDDGDVVIVQPATSIVDGDMVVAWLKMEKEATLKRLYRDGKRIRLQPANATMQPIFLDPENIDIQGKVVAVLRAVR